VKTENWSFFIKHRYSSVLLHFVSVFPNWTDRITNIFLDIYRCIWLYRDIDIDILFCVYNSGQFTLRDMYEQFQNIMKMGPFSQIMVSILKIVVIWNSKFCGVTFFRTISKLSCWFSLVIICIERLFVVIYQIIVLDATNNIRWETQKKRKTFVVLTAPCETSI